MPARPANIHNSQDILPTVNQLIRELQIRIDNVHKQTPPHRTFAASGTLNFGAISPGLSVERNIQVAGATQSGTVFASPQLQIGDHLQWSSYIASSGIITVRVSNPTAGTLTPNVVKWNAMVVS